MNGRRRGRRRRSKKETAELSARLAPLEEQQEAGKAKGQTLQAMPSDNGRRGGTDDTIRIDTSKVRIPTEFVEDERKGARIFYLEPIAVVILALMLAFIAFVAWQVSGMPPPAK